MTSITGVATDFIQFTRASNATVTDSDGKVKWAPHNLLTNSESFDASAWPKNAITISANSVVAPNGTTTADTMSDTAVNIIHWTGQYLTALSPAGLTFTISAFCKANTLNYVTLGLSDISVGNLYATAVFNLSNGTVATTGASGTGYSVVGTPTISAVGNGWYLCSVTTTAGTSVSFLNAVIGLNKTGIISPTAGGFESYLGNGSGIYVWGAACYRSDLGGMQANTSAYPMYNPTTPKNLLGYTEDFSNAAWTKTATTITSNVVLAPNGLQTADKVVATAASGFHGVRQGFTYGTGTYTISIYAKAAEYTKLYISDLSFGNAFAAYDLVSGTVISSGGGPKLVSANIEAAPNGFFRCSLVVTNINTSSTPTFVGYPTGATLSANGADYTGDGTSGIYIWGAQISDSASLDTYSPVYGAAVTSAAYYGPRRDFDPVTLACKGLLVEEQRTNLFLQSAAFDASWSPSQVTITANATTSPDGTATADALIPSTVAAAAKNVTQSPTFTVAPYTITTYAKAFGYNWIYLREDTSGAARRTYFNISAGTVGTVSAGHTASITSVGNGWHRCSITFTGAAGAFAAGIFVTTADAAATMTGDGTSGVYVWGAQLEAGSFATSYIPTGAATATRSVDVASVSTQAFPYSNTEGTLVVSADTYDVNSASGVLLATISSGAASNSVNVGVYLSKTTLSSTVGGVAQAFLQPSGTISANTVFKAGGAFATNSFIASSNGTLSTEDTVGTLPVGPTTLGIGNISSSLAVNGHIRQITYLPRRISNTELQTRTQ